MQTLARDGLTAAEVTVLLQADEVSVTAGCERLNAALTTVEDISDDLESGSVNRYLYATIHGTCKLTLTRSLAWGVDLVRPYVTLSDGVRTARFNLGVYILTTPEREVGEEPVTYDVTGYDRVYLLNRQVGATYTVTAGTNYRTALLAAFAAAGLTGVLIEGSAGDLTLPATRVWALVAESTDPDQTATPVTYLRIVNDLLTAINFRGVWADENGYFRCESYRPPVQRAPEFVFDADDLTGGIVGEQRKVVEDVWATPNRWVFRQTNRASGAPVATEGDGLYTVVNQSDGPTSIDQRGLTWTSVIDYEAASQAVLVGLGDRKVAADRASNIRYDVTVGPFPPAGHADIYTYRDSAAGADRKVQMTALEIDLLGADTRMVWEAV